MSVLAKMKVRSVEDFGDTYGEVYKTINMHCEYDTSLPEDQRFAIATPTGSVKITLTNPALKEYFKPGQVFLLTLDLVE